MDPSDDEWPKTQTPARQNRADVAVSRAALRDAVVLARMLGEARREDGVEPWSLDVETVRLHALGAKAKLECWVARLAAAPVGCATAHRGFDIRLGRPSLCLNALYVEPDHRGGGVARALLSAAAARALEMGAREVLITAGLGNATAQRFLRSLGAEEHQAAAYILSFDHLEWMAQETR